MIKVKYLITVLILCSFCICTPLSAIEKTPADISSMIEEDNQALKEKRQEWIDEMHGAETGVDWRILENEARQSKYELRNQKIREKMSEGKLTRDQILNESVILGTLEGEWRERGSNNQSGRIITVDLVGDEQLYAISAGGNVWKGNIEGENWTCINNGRKFNGKLIKVFGHDGKQRIVVVSNNDVYRSDDDGLTWEGAEGFENLKRWGGIRRGISSSDKKTYYAVSNEWDYDDWGSYTAVYRSDDAGETFDKFMKLETGSGLVDIWSPLYDGSDLYVMHLDTIFRYDRDGVLLETNLFDLDPPAAQFDALHSIMLKGSVVDGTTYLVAAFRTSTSPKIHFYVSEDHGKSWEKRGNLDINPFMINSFEVSYDDPDIMFFGGVELFRSYDGGNTWEVINKWGDYYGDPREKLHADIPAINVLRDTDGFEFTFISTDGGLYISYDNLYTVFNISLYGLNVSQYYSVYTSKNDNNVIFAGSQDQGFQRCQTDSGGTLGFTQTISGDYGQITSSDGGTHLWTLYPTFLMLYKNAEKTIKAYTWRFTGQGWLWMPPTWADPADPTSVYVAGGGSEGGSHLWHVKYSVSDLYPEELAYDFAEIETDSKLTAIAVSEIKHNYIYAMTNKGKFLVSANKGENWTITEQDSSFKAPGGHYFYGASILPSRLQFGTVYIAGNGSSNPGAYVSYDNGNNFVPIDSGLPNALVYELDMTEDEKYIFAATQLGPYIFDVDKQVWYDMAGLSAPDQTYWSIDYIPEIKTARFATYGRGIWDFRITGTVAVDEKQDQELVPQIAITASPNPVDESTIIRFNLDQSANVGIRIYDMNSRIVDDISPGSLDPGNHSTSWKAVDNRGQALPAGMYLCIISANGNSNYVKLVVE